MVRLDNPYSFNRPRPFQYFLIAGLFIIAYIIKKTTSFYFIYQFSLPIMLVLLMGYISDKSILSKKMLIGGEFPELGHIYFIIAPTIISALFVFITRLFNIEPHYFFQFSSQGVMHQGELFVLMALVFVPAAEIIFRGYFQFIYSHLFGKKAGIAASVITYLLFFLLLTNNVFVICYAAVMGVLLSYIAFRENSVLPAIIGHEIIILAMILFKF